MPGFVDMIQWASGLVFAIPLAIIGLEFFSSGRTVIGSAFFALAIIMFLLPEYVTRKVGSPRSWVKRRLVGMVGRENER